MTSRIGIGIGCLALLLSLEGCADDPLVFSSGNTLGIKIAVSPSESQPVKLNVGWDNLDSAIVPTSADAKRTPVRASTAGCVTKDEAAKECASSGAVVQSNATDNSQVTGTVGQSDTSAGDSTLSPADGQNQAAASTAARMGATGLPIVSAMPGKGGQEKRSDALSVLAIFDSSGSGNASAGVGFHLGKTFATGVAAQNLTEGIQVAAAQSATARSQCIAALSEAMGAGKVTPDDITKICVGAETK